MNFNHFTRSKSYISNHLQLRNTNGCFIRISSAQFKLIEGKGKESLCSDYLKKIKKRVNPTKQGLVLKHKVSNSTAIS